MIVPVTSYAPLSLPRNRFPRCQGTAASAWRLNLNAFLCPDTAPFLRLPPGHCRPSVCDCEAWARAAEKCRAPPTNSLGAGQAQGPTRTEQQRQMRRQMISKTHLDWFFQRDATESHFPIRPWAQKERYRQYRCDMSIWHQLVGAPWGPGSAMNSLDEAVGWYRKPFTVCLAAGPCCGRPTPS